MTHSRLAPSSAHRWVKCPGSVQMQEHYPEEQKPSNAAREGTEAHEQAAQMVDDEAHGRRIYGYGEMYEACKLYADHIGDEMRRLGVFTPMIEHRVEAPSIIHPESHGTLDVALFNGIELIVCDFKYGFRPVEAFENWQLINYAAGLVEQLQIRTDNPIKVTLKVVQPRAYHPDGPIRNWTVWLSDLRGYWNQLSLAAYSACGDNPTVTSGEHCLYCRAIHACPAMRKLTLSLSDRASPEELPPEWMGKELSILKQAQQILNMRTAALEEQIKSNIDNVPGWTMEPTYSRKKWNRPDNEIINMGKMMGIDLSKSVTPAEAKKLGIDTSVIQAYSESVVTGSKLTPSDKSKVAKAFKKK